jgi:hypothetical protein
MTAVAEVVMTAGWFGPADRPLYGVWHLPSSGLARSAVVLAPSLGLELDLGHRSLRVLADRLAAQGIAALRFDYDGTGDSAGDDTEVGRVGAWLASVRAAVAAARTAGAGHVTVVGLRVGATLAVASRSGADSYVLWDACATGKSFLRQESVMFALNVSTIRPEPRTDGSVDGPGSVYTAETVADLGAVALLADDLLGSPATLVLIRDDKPDTRTTKALAGVAGVEIEACAGQAALLEVSGFISRVPLGTVGRIVDWVSTQAPAEARPITPSIESSAVVERLPDGTSINESVQSLGPHRLFAILTEPIGQDVPDVVDAVPPAPVTVVFSNSATTYHVGSARSWVELSRRLARDGVRGLRVDQRDLGDGPEVDEPPGPVYYNSESLEDLRAAAEIAGSASGVGSSDREGAVVLVGLCSGSWSSAVVAHDVSPAGVLLLNPWIWHRDVEPVGPVAYPQREVFTARVSRALTDRHRLRALGARVLSWVWAMRPDFLWRAAATLHLGDTTGATVGRLVEGGSHVTIVMGPRESQIFRRGLGYLQERRLARSGRLHLVERPALDHGMLHSREREVVLDQVVADVLALAARPLEPTPAPAPHHTPAPATP